MTQVDNTLTIVALPREAPPLHALAEPAQTAPVVAAAPIPALARWLTVLVRLFWMFAGLGVALAGIAAVRGVLANGDWMYSDGVQLWHVLRIRDGLAAYPDFQQSPFLALVYWPLYFVTSGLLARLFDLGMEGSLYLLRSLAVLGTLGAAASIAGLAALSGARRPGAIAAAALFLTAYVVHPWAYAARADLPALGLVLGGLFVALRSRGVGSVVLAGLLFAAGFACKQTYVVAFGVAMLTLLWRREWLRVFALGGTWAGCIAGTVLLAEASSGGLFLHNTVSSNVLPFRLQTMISHVTLYLPMSLPLLALAVLGLFGTVRRGSALGPMRLYLLLAAATGLVTISRAGSYYNHLLETTAVLAVFGGIGFDRCLSVLKRLTAPADMVPRPGPERWLATAALAVAVGGFGLPLLAIAVKAGDPPDRTSLIAALRAANGPVLTEKDALAVMLARKEPIGGDPLGVGLLARQGTWDPAPLNQMVDSQAFGLIALNNPADDGAAFDEFQWWPPGTRELIQQRYQLDRRQDGFYMYVPRTTEAGR